MGLVQFGRRRCRCAAGVAMASLVTWGLSAWVVPADTKHAGYAQVTNGCAVPIAVVIGDTPNSYVATDGTSLMPVFNPGETKELAESLRLPLSDAIYAWIVAPGAAQLGLPHEVAVATLKMSVSPHGTSIYYVPIAGDLRVDVSRGRAV